MEAKTYCTLHKWKDYCLVIFKMYSVSQGWHLGL